MPDVKKIRKLKPAPLSGGWLPDENPDWAPILAQAWAEQEIDRTPLPMSVADRKWRASWSSSRCDRQLYYHMAATETSDELSLADHWRFWLGHLVHAHFQKAAIEVLSKLGYTVEVELAVDLMPFMNGAAHADMAVTIPTRDEEGDLVIVELKTINGTGFKETSCTYRGKPPKGPKPEHVIQAAVAATALGAERIKIIYLSMECVGKELASFIDVNEIGRFCSQFTIERDYFEPIAEEEAQRVALMEQFLGLGRLPDRTMWDPELNDKPGRPIVTDPMTGAGLRYGMDGAVLSPFKSWRCRYCPFQAKCASDA